MPHHGEFDAKQTKWFCGYWLSEKEWDDIHDYSPQASSPDDGHPDDDSEE